MTTFHVFLSYARADNGANADGWVTAFHDRLTAEHARYSGTPLSVFFDRHAIRDGQDWERRIYTGLRNSRLFVAFLSPNYLKSEWCRREWESYLRLEHSLARGDDGIKQVFFVTVPEVHGSADATAALPPDMAAWIADMHRRNRGHAFDLRDWFTQGPQALREIDAAERLAELRANPRTERDKALVSLADRIAAIDRSIANRLDRAALAELALEQGNIGRSYPHFVGRHRELTQLHDQLTAKRRVGVISALHGLGGQGKTALAEQYSYAYAEHYAAGGRWKLPCEGQTSLAAVLEPLVRGLAIPSDAPPPERVRLTLTALRERARTNVETIDRQLSELPDLHTREGERPKVEASTLLILDNVDRAELLSAAEAAQIFAESWLKVIVTTREPPDSFGIGKESLAAIAVDDLPPEDALALIRDYRALDDPAEAAAAREIVRRIGGFTLAVELVAAYLAANESTGLTVAGYLARLDREGIGSTDGLAKDQRTVGQIRYEREKQIGILVDQMTAALSPPAGEALAFASLLPPDQIVTEWLRLLVAAVHTEIGAAPQPGYPDRWAEVVRELTGRRLLLPAEQRGADGGSVPRLLRLHRMVGGHVSSAMPLAACEARIAALVALVHQFQAAFEHGWQENPAWLWYLAPLEATVELLMIDQPDRRELAMAAAVAATAELSVGSMLRGESLLSAAQTSFLRASQANPEDGEAARLVSASLERLGDFYVSRGQEGDAERALEAFQESLDTRQRLYEANPTSAAAARDVSVSHWMLARLHEKAGNAAERQRHLSACFSILDGFHHARRPMDPQMRQLHAHLAKALGGGSSAADGDDAGGNLPDALVRQVFADPRADGLLRQVMAQNKLDGEPAALPFETQRAMVEALVRAGVIQLGG